MLKLLAAVAAVVVHLRLLSLLALVEVQVVIRLNISL
jgi:hypothetical protein